MMPKLNWVARIAKTLKLTALSFGLFWGSAIVPSIGHAAPIGNASFGIGGAFTLPSGSHLGNTNSIFISNGGMITVSQDDYAGDLSGLVIVGLTTGTLRDLPTLATGIFAPITGFITLSSGVTVDLNTLTVMGQGGPAPGFINIAGNAVINAPGFFDPTPGVLTFTGNSSDNATFTLAITTSANTPAGVPEPLSLALLGLGLLALFVIARRRSVTPSQLAL